MQTDMNELDQLMQVDPESHSKPCGCQDSQDVALDASGNPADPASLEAELDAFLGSVPSGEDELAFASLDAGLADPEELELAPLGEENLPTLEDVLRIAESYPGLKITLSF